MGPVFDKVRELCKEWPRKENYLNVANGLLIWVDLLEKEAKAKPKESVRYGS